MLVKNEERFYPIVLEYLKTCGYLTEGYSESEPKFHFIRLGKRVQADVAGIKDVGNLYSNEIEIAAVEVKDGMHCKVRYIEQALGYSTFAHKCYLAMPIHFTEDDKNYARHMGVGLLEINGKKVSEILSPELKDVNETIMIYFLRRSLNLVKCVICGSIIHRFRSGTKSFHRKNVFEKRKTLFVCPDCYRTFNMPVTDSEEIKPPEVRKEAQ